MRRMRFDEALRVVSGRNKIQEGVRTLLPAPTEATQSA